MKKNLINVWALSKGTRALGPGKRFVVWTQGCLKHCPGCTSPESRPLEDRILLTPEALADEILRQKDIEGFTVSGGEPFLQAAQLAETLSLVKEARPELNVIVFTGYRLGELTSEDARKLLEYVDVLVDGPFVQGKKTGTGLRGSSNQEIHFLTDRLLPWKEVLLNGPRILESEFDLDKGETVTIGIPTDAFPMNFTKPDVKSKKQSDNE